ncbi:MAG: flagellar biosynthesis anti-sigma factor FlgM [Planctomycetota bacterium]
MQIFGPFRVSTAQNASTPQRVAAKPAEAAPRSSAPVDQLDLSSAAEVGSVNRLESTSPVAGNGEIRLDRVADLRRQIAEGSYDTPERMDAALDRLLDQIG